MRGREMRSWHVYSVDLARIRGQVTSYVIKEKCVRNKSAPLFTSKDICEDLSEARRASVELAPINGIGGRLIKKCVQRKDPSNYGPLKKFV